MSKADPDGAELGVRLSNAVIFFHEALARSRGLSGADHKALGVIERHGPMSAGELADRTGLSPGAVTGLVDRLVASGHVSREPDQADRRRVVVRATSKLPPEIESAFTALSDRASDFACRYTASEVAAIVDWVEHMIDLLEQQTRLLEVGGRDPKRQAVAVHPRTSRMR